MRATATTSTQQSNSQANENRKRETLWTLLEPYENEPLSTIGRPEAQIQAVMVFQARECCLGALGPTSVKAEALCALQKSI
jgi:hypothetical protein